MKRLLFFILLLPIFTVPCRGEGLYDMPEVSAVENALGDEEREISGKLRLDGSYDANTALERLWDKLLSAAGAALRESAASGAAIVAIGFLCCCGSSFVSDKNVQTYISIAGCCAAALLLAGSMDSMVTQASDAINRLSDYSKAAMPAVFTAASVCGAILSAPAKYAAACLAMDIIISAAQNMVIPLIYAYIAISVCRSIFPNPVLNSAAKVSKWCAVTVMTALTLAFSAYISLTGLVAGSTDAVAVKTARTVISQTLPVVGGIISDAASTVLSAAAVIKNSAGVFSLVAVCAMCAAPFAALSVKMLLLKAAAAVTDMLPDSRLSGLVGDMGTAMGMMLGLLGCCGIMLFVSIMSGIRVVSG